jgi:NAD(P)-dependent dehydrogenase (short-subunit alcohol dehydrogenase family)
MAVPRARTADGFEMQLGVNHLGHFALTGLRLEPLLAAPEARVVTVSSVMHWTGKLRFDDLDFDRRYDPWLAYGQSKLANALFALELSRRFAQASVRAKSLGAHPGYAATNLQFVGPELERSWLKRGFFQMGNALFSQNAERGAWPLLHALTDPSVESGDYIGPGALELWGKPAPAKLSSRARDPETAARLWAVSIERTGVDYAALTARTR